MSDKKKVGEARDILDAIGQEGEKKGAKWTIYFNNLWKQKELEKNQLRENKLRKNRRGKKEYFNILRDMLQDMVTGVERPSPGYKVGTGFNSVGIWVEMWDRWGRTYKRAIKPTGYPKYDLPAILTLVGSTEDTMWELEDKKVTDKGVFLP